MMMTEMTRHLATEAVLGPGLTGPAHGAVEELEHVPVRHAVMDDQVVTDLGVIRAAFDRTFERSTLQ